MFYIFHENKFKNVLRISFIFLKKIQFSFERKINMFDFLHSHEWKVANRTKKTKTCEPRVYPTHVNANAPKNRRGKGASKKCSARWRVWQSHVNQLFKWTSAVARQSPTGCNAYRTLSNRTSITYEILKKQIEPNQKLVAGEAFESWTKKTRGC